MQNRFSFLVSRFSSRAYGRSRNEERGTTKRVKSSNSVSRGRPQYLRSTRSADSRRFLGKNQRPSARVAKNANLCYCVVFVTARCMPYKSFVQYHLRGPAKSGRSAG